MTFASGIIVNVELSWLAPSKLRRTVLVGSERMVIYDEARPSRCGCSIAASSTGIRRRSASTTSPTAAATSSRRRSSRYEPLGLELRRLRHGDSEPATAWSSTRRSRGSVVRIVEAADESLRAGGREVSLDHGDIGAQPLRVESSRPYDRVSARRPTCGPPQRGALSPDRGRRPRDPYLGVLPTSCAGARVGADCNICDHTFVEGDVVVGDRVTIKSGVYCGTACDSRTTCSSGRRRRSPTTRSRAASARSNAGQRQSARGASIGAGAVILPGITVGEGAMVGAGAVVTKGVPDPRWWSWAIPLASSGCSIRTTSARTGT